MLPCTPQPTLQARRDLAKGIADRIQRLAADISSIKVHRSVAVTRDADAGSGTSGDRSSIEREVDKRIADAVPGQPAHFTNAVKAAMSTPPRPVVRAVTKPSPVRPSADVKPAVAKPSRRQAAALADESFDKGLEAEIFNYMRSSPEVDNPAAPAAGDIVIPARVHGAKPKPAPAPAPSAVMKQDKPPPSPGLAAAAREKLAGQTAALRRRSIVEKV